MCDASRREIGYRLGRVPSATVDDEVDAREVATVTRIVQIRTYTVREGLLDEWVERWQRLVVPLRRDLGFEIRGSWKDRTRNQHIWVISYDGPGSFEEANATYWASERRKSLGLEPGDYLVGEETREVEQTL